ncbi:hypothetical protein LX36DRAFT_642870 [Colletotrichum falcatum]|nr:hypothetical protein LX36DRAFT_642870 [Colletotrichum falcatum]
MAFPPPPPYPPPVSNPAPVHPSQQHNMTEPQYAPVPIPAAYNQTPNHTGGQQHPPPQVRQAPQLYQPQPYQPRPLAPQQTARQQQQPDPLPTPVSPPYSANGAAAQACSGYFPATTAPQNHAVYNPQKWAERPYGQEPYTPAATPTAPFAPQTGQAYPAHPQ